MSSAPTEFEVLPQVEATSSSPDTATTADTASTSKSSGRVLYSVVWRWHFYAGLFVAPVLLVITLTGALYVFRTELTAMRDHDLLVVSPQRQRISHDELLRRAKDHFSPHDVEAMIVHPEQNRSVRFVAHVESEVDGHLSEQHHYQLYMNPYTGEVLGEQIQEHDFFHIILELHRNLMLGTTGRIIGELATSWGMLLLATGVFLWWPRGKKNVGVWLPRVRGKMYSVLRDWHVVAGFYLVPLAAVIIGTGLFFTVVLGTAFNTTVQQAGHWPAAWFGTPKSGEHADEAAPASLDAVVATLVPQSRPDDTIMVRLANGPDAAHQAWLLHDEDKNSFRMVAVDQYTAQTVNRVGSDEVPFLYRIRLWAVSTHMGQIFGTPTKILALITCLGLLGLIVTGIWMWWRRRPDGRTGFPRRPVSRVIPAWGWGIVLASGIVLPVAGLSMVLISLLDYAIRRLFRRKIDPGQLSPT